MDGQDEVINNNNNNNSDNNNDNNNNNNDNNNDNNTTTTTNVGAGQLIVKGKRTKRQRPQSPIPFRMMTATNTCYKSDEGSDICSNNNNNVVEDMTTGTTTTTVVSDDDDIYFNGGGTTTEEEEDMANCLILLAQGHSRDLPPQHPPPFLSLVDDHTHKSNNNNNSVIPPNKFISRKFMEATSTTGKSGYYVYECKTCGKTFSSFQALGGHRASHKKPKNKDEDYTNKSRSNDNIFSSIITSNNNNKNNYNHNNNSNLLLSSDDEEPPFKVARHNNNNNNNNVISSNSLSLQLTNRALYSNHHSSNKGRVHECSICGAEFSSGQALGGHMRRHRGPVSATMGASSATPVIRAVPLAIEQAAAPTEISHDEIMITPMKIPPIRNTNTSTNTNTSVLSLDLDLNLPAPPDDNAGNHHQRESKFVFESKQHPIHDQSQPPSPTPPPPPPPQQQQQQQLVFSSPALVDCHY